MKNPFLSLFRARDKPRDAISDASPFYFGSSVSGKSINPKNAVQASTVYACVRVIAETIASLLVGVWIHRARQSESAGSSSVNMLLVCNARSSQILKR